ncbi:MAG: hypothetical protein LBG90_01505 [Spirochaetaceae bacterium]|jgi:hypothetical protein|nr:hypothetical protein [Spirochaetaceae bacterium]
MDINLLAKKLLDAQEYAELTKAIKLLENNNFEIFYNNYSNILETLFFVHSYEAFMDFIEENETVKANIFILGFLAKKNKCIEIGGYECELERRIKQFIAEKNTNELNNNINQLHENVYTDYDGEDNFREYISKLNGILIHYKLKIVIFFNDLYCVCAYNLFLLDISFVDHIINEWQDDDIQIII